MSFILGKSNSKNYHVYQHEQYGNDCILIFGRTQEGNDYILSNLSIIMMDLFQIEINETNLNNIIWLHGHGPSPHFLLYRSSKEIKLDANSIEIFIKGKCPIKSDKNLPLTCTLLSNVIKTDIKGLVNVKQVYKLSKLLSSK